MKSYVPVNRYEIFFHVILGSLPTLLYCITNWTDAFKKIFAIAFRGYSTFG